MCLAHGVPSRNSDTLGNSCGKFSSRPETRHPPPYIDYIKVTNGSRFEQIFKITQRPSPNEKEQHDHQIPACVEGG